MIYIIYFSIPERRKANRDIRQEQIERETREEDKEKMEGKKEGQVILHT